MKMVKFSSSTVAFVVVWAALILGQLTPACEAVDVKGVINLDRTSFEKLVESNQFYILVKFDKAYPFGEKEDEFKSFVKQLHTLPGTEKILTTSVAVQDAGERKNLDLAEDFEAADESRWPEYKLFVPQPAAIPYEDWTPVTHTGNYSAEDLLRFLKTNTYPELTVSLPGCLESMDKLAFGFLWVDDAADIQSRVSQAEAIANAMDASDVNQPWANFYVTVMKSVLRDGPGFVGEEKAKLANLLATNAVGEKIKAEIKHKLNVLAAFRNYRCSYGGGGEEGCLYTFDKLASGYLSATPEAQSEVIERAKRAQSVIADPASKASAEGYVKYLQKIHDQGAGFVASERARLLKVMQTPMSEAKWQQFKLKYAILHTFTS